MKLDLLSRDKVRSRERIPPITYVRAEDLKRVSGTAQCSWFGPDHVMYTCGNYNL